MNKIKNFFFDKEEWEELGTLYKILMIVAPISIAITILVQMA